VPLAERLEVVAALSGVDYVTSFPEPTADALILALRPALLVKGTDRTPENVPERETLAACGGRVLICGDPKSHSSSELIRKLGG
jgi:bifunctional ADP-heptose synthase (sugar kinase/adenylyltransferase)